MYALDGPPKPGPLAVTIAHVRFPVRPNAPHEPVCRGRQRRSAATNPEELGRWLRLVLLVLVTAVVVGVVLSLASAGHRSPVLLGLGWLLAALLRQFPPWRSDR